MRHLICGTGKCKSGKYTGPMTSSLRDHKCSTGKCGTKMQDSIENENAYRKCRTWKMPDGKYK